MFDKIAVTTKIDLPSSAVGNGWEIAAAIKNANSEFATDYSSWTPTDIGTPTVTGGIVSFTAVAADGALEQAVTTISGHVYYFVARVNTNSADVKIAFDSTAIAHGASGDYEIIKGLLTASSTASTASVYDERTSSWTQILIDYFRVYDLTDIFGAGNEPSAANFATWLAAYCDFRLNLDTFGAATIIKPATNAAIANAYASSVYTLASFNTLSASLAAGIAIDSAGGIHLVLPFTTASTLSALYTYIIANPLSVVAEVASATTHPTVFYVQQVGANALTVSFISSTCSLPSDFELDYCKDIAVLLAALA